MNIKRTNQRPKKNNKHPICARLLILSMLLAILTLTAPTAFSQPSVQTLSSARFGKLPFSQDDRRNPTIYTDVLFEQRYRWLTAGFRVEGFRAPDPIFGGQSANTFNEVSQRYLEVNYSWLSARVGNVYGILGQGI